MAICRNTDAACFPFVPINHLLYHLLSNGLQTLQTPLSNGLETIFSWKAPRERGLHVFMNSSFLAVLQKYVVLTPLGCWILFAMISAFLFLYLSRRRCKMQTCRSSSCAGAGVRRTECDEGRVFRGR
jgi:hypothetical protein